MTKKLRHCVMSEFKNSWNCENFLASYPFPHLIQNQTLTLSNPIFLPTAYSPALINCGRQRGWWITCWLKSVLHEEKCRTGSYIGAGEQTRKKKSVGQAPTAERANKRKKSVGRHPTLEQNGKIIMSDEVRRRIRKG